MGTAVMLLHLLGRGRNKLLWWWKIPSQVMEYLNGQLASDIIVRHIMVARRYLHPTLLYDKHPSAFGSFRLYQ
jgi:hypothetical protein